MKVIREAEKRATYFSDLRMGDVFLFCEKPFIKIYTCKINSIENNTIINAVCLNDGEIYEFNAWDKVESVNAELTIKVK